MLRDDLFQQLRSAGLVSIPVKGGIDTDDIRGAQFLGDLAGFLAAATALGSRAVFVAEKALTESDFCHEDRSEETEDGKPIVVDLTTLQPKLSKYKERLGACCGQRLWLLVQTTTLELVDHESWWSEFCKLRDEAIQAIQKKREEKWVEQQKQTDLLRDDVLKRVRALIDDANFFNLPTQGAMQSYAMEHIPELAVLGLKAIREEIRALDGKIKVKGLRTKKAGATGSSANPRTTPG